MQRCFVLLPPALVWLHFCKHTNDVNQNVIAIHLDIYVKLQGQCLAQTPLVGYLHFPLCVLVIWICLKCVRTVGEDAMCGHVALHVGNFADHEIAILRSSLSRRTRRGQT